MRAWRWCYRKSCAFCGRSAAPPLQTFIASIQTPYPDVHREHGDGLSQELCILRAERSSAPTDLYSKYLYTAH